MLIAIEGMDGVGKTTIAKLLAKEMNFKYIDRPMKYFLNISDDQYDDLCIKIWGYENKNITSMFFGLGNIVSKSLGENIIVDRHILSSYFWDFNENNSSLFEFISNDSDVVPDLTIILYADIDTRINRIKNRNINDSDLNDKVILQEGYDKMIDYAQKINLPYVVINTMDKNISEVFQECLEIIDKYNYSNDKKVLRKGKNEI